MLSEDVHKAHVGTRMLNNEYRITDTELDVDTPINFTIKPFEVIVMEGINTNQEAH